MSGSCVQNTHCRTPSVVHTLVRLCVTRGTRIFTAFVNYWMKNLWLSIQDEEQQYNNRECSIDTAVPIYVII